MNSESMPFEKAMERLQLIVKKMEAGELSLEESLRQFEEGVSLARQCQAQLSDAEKKVEILMQIQADGSATTQPFQPPTRG